MQDKRYLNLGDIGVGLRGGWLYMISTICTQVFKPMTHLNNISSTCSYLEYWQSTLTFWYRSYYSMLHAFITDSDSRSIHFGEGILTVKG